MYKMLCTFNSKIRIYIDIIYIYLIVIIKKKKKKLILK